MSETRITVAHSPDSDDAFMFYGLASNNVERTGGLPLPLGGNIIRRDLGAEMIRKVLKLLHDNIAYALSHRKEAVEYAEQFGRGLDRERTDKFVGMYVNDLTLGYGERGRKAAERLMTEAFERGLIPNRVPVEFA